MTTLPAPSLPAGDSPPFWTLARLAEALEHLSARHGSAGADEQTLAEFAADAEAQLGLLALQLTRGTYRPEPFRLIPVAKPGGGVRELLVPAVRDRIVQAVLAKRIADLLEPDFSEASHAYRPGRSVASALHRLQALRDGGLVFVAACDIQHFFDSVDHRRLSSLLNALPLEPGLLELVEKTCLRVEVVAGQERGAWSLARGLAQGSPLSPVLANLFLMAFDAACEDAGLALVRYADDCVLACASEAEARKRAGLRHRRAGEHGACTERPEDPARFLCRWLRIPWQLLRSHRNARRAIGRGSLPAACRRPGAQAGDHRRR